jgi:hypothetical protein
LTGGAEFGIEVERQFKTPARTSLEVTPNTVGVAIRDAELVKIQPGAGISEGELLAKMTDEERAVYVAEKEARKGDIQSRTPGYVPPPVVTTNLASMNQPGMRSQPQPKAQVITPSATPVVGKVASTQSKVQDGISVGLTSGGGVETFDASGSTGQATESVLEHEGITFRNTNGPKKGFGMAPALEATPSDAEPKSRIDNDGTADYRRMVAKSLCKDFPDDYSFSDHWKRRIAMIRLNYEKCPEVIRAIFAAESDEFKKLLIEEFPEAFSG